MRKRGTGMIYKRGNTYWIKYSERGDLAAVVTKVVTSIVVEKIKEISPPEWEQ